MSNRILVIDDVEPNVRLLEAKLTLEYYDVLTAGDGVSALRLARTDRPDLILLDVMMPGMDGFETCRRLKADPATRHIPIVLVTALDGREDFIKGLEAGADDFVTKPIDDVILFAKLKNRLRAKTLVDNLRIGRPASDEAQANRGPGQVLIVDDQLIQAERLRDGLKGQTVEVLADPALALTEAGRGFDLLVIDLTSSSYDGLRLLAQLKAGPRSGRTPVLGVCRPQDRPRLIKALELGVDDIVPLPLDPVELAIRARHLIARKRMIDALMAPFIPSSQAQAGGTDEYAQRPAPHRFGWKDGQIQVVPTFADPTDIEVTEDVLQGLRVKVTSALGGLVGNHADPRLEQSMTAFLDCISGPPEGVRGGRLLMRYRSLQADATAYGEPTSERDRTVKALVDDVSASAADLIVLYPDLRAIEDARLALELSDVSGLRGELAAITHAASQSVVVSMAAADALAEMTVEGDAALAYAPLTIEPSWIQANDKKSTVSIGLQLLTVRNFCTAALKSIGGEVAAITAESLKEARSAVPRGVGSGVERVVSGSIIMALVTLMATLAGPLAGIATLAATFRPIAERARKIRDAIDPPGEDS